MLKKLEDFMQLQIRDLLYMAGGCALMAFAVVNIHIPAQITEGGILGLSLFFYKVLGWDPGWMSPLLDFLCYLIGFSLLGRKFIKRALFATLSYSLSFSLFHRIGPVLPSLIDHPFLASLLGGLCIGIGCSVVVLRGAAAGGDDALALVMEKHTPLKLGLCYFLSDFIVLSMSLIYLPFTHIAWSLVTTTISSWTISRVEELAEASAASA
uniref:YitT family protein n=1 Tax=Ndongobacter massiliensis TaxID=1871025 RepID=UPI0009309F0C|nr:YitT family protein [Ndongobacter massiliensis]